MIQPRGQIWAVRLLWVVAFLSVVVRKAQAAVACDNDSYCEQMVRPGSVCDSDGFCTNPFAQGCLRRMLGEDVALDRNFNVRRCNSDDPEDAEELGLCSGSYFNFTEIRIHNGNWESSIFYAWIIQILLSELVEVPVTIGLGPDTSEGSFYHNGNAFPYSPKAYPFEALEEANSVRDCRLSDQDCAHVLPEVWNGQEAAWNQALEDGYIEPVEGNGMTGQSGYYIPAITAQGDDSLVSFYGLGGGHNRQKLAKTFPRPTNWLDYCREESPTNCTSFDGVTDRWPTSDEESVYFSSGSFTGYFRETEESNCDINNQTCTGHVIGPNCGWSTYLEAQMYHNDIALTSSGPLTPNAGYTYGQMVQIWRAANATNNNVMLWWWMPEALVEEFRGTAYEFQPVLLPQATEECRNARISPEDRCSDDIWVRRGDAAGACDYNPHALQKVISRSLRTDTYELEQVYRSPGYDMVKNIKITDLALNAMMKSWISIGVDRYGYDPREAVCSWVAENIDSLVTLIPPGYPREFDDTSPYDYASLYVIQGVGGLSILVVMITSAAVYYYRKKRVFVYAQFHFLMPMLVGFFFYGIAAIVVVVEPSTGACMSTQWLILVGLTMQLVPLLIKIAAINRVLQSAKKMRRVKIAPSHMFSAVVFLVMVIVVYLTVWTVVDPLKKVETLYLPEEDGNVIERSIECAAKSNIWVLASFVWVVFLLVCTAVLAFQSRNVNQEFNESKILGRTVYAHFLFLLLRLVVEFLQDKWQPNVVAAIVSLLISLETLCTLAIYFVPKFVELKLNKYARDNRQSHVFASTHSGYHSSADNESGHLSEGFSRGSLATNRGGVKVSNEIANIEAAAAAAAAAYRESTVSQVDPVREISEEDASVNQDSAPSLNPLSQEHYRQGRNRASVESTECSTSVDEGKENQQVVHNETYHQDKPTLQSISVLHNPKEDIGGDVLVESDPAATNSGARQEDNVLQQPPPAPEPDPEQVVSSARDRKRLLEAAAMARHKAEAHRAMA